jgi:hypothetical protein
MSFSFGFSHAVISSIDGRWLSRTRKRRRAESPSVIYVDSVNGGTVADVLDAQYPIEVNANQRGIVIGVIRR